MFVTPRWMPPKSAQRRSGSLLTVAMFTPKGRFLPETIALVFTPEPERRKTSSPVESDSKRLRVDAGVSG